MNPSESLRDQYESRVGRMAMTFPLIESLLERFAWDIWGIPEEFAHILTKDLPIKQLIAKLQSSLKELEIDSDTSLQMKQLLSRVEKLLEKRNELVHALWLIEKDQIRFLPRKRRSGTEPTSPSLDDLEALVNSVIDLADELSEFWRRNRLLGAIGLATRKKYGKSDSNVGAKLVPKQHDPR